MPNRPHGRAQVDSRYPSAWGVCDRCGFLYNLKELQFQYQWYGPRTQNTQMRVCPTCMDVLQEQLRTIIIPADPVPVANPRIERYRFENNPASGVGTAIGTMTQGGGLAAAFDSAVNKPMAFCCQLFNSLNGYTNSVGKFWHEGNQIAAARFVATAPNDASFYASGPVDWKFQGSNYPYGFSFADLASGTTTGAVGEVIDVEPTGGTYLYHQLVFNGNGINSIAIAQLKIYARG